MTIAQLKILQAKNRITRTYFAAEDDLGLLHAGAGGEAGEKGGQFVPKHAQGGAGQGQPDGNGAAQPQQPAIHAAPAAPKPPPAPMTPEQAAQDPAFDRQTGRPIQEPGQPPTPIVASGTKSSGSSGSGNVHLALNALGIPMHEAKSLAIRAIGNTDEERVAHALRNRRAPAPSLSAKASGAPQSSAGGFGNVPGVTSMVPKPSPPRPQPAAPAGQSAQTGGSPQSSAAGFGNVPGVTSSVPKTGMVGKPKPAQPQPAAQKPAAKISQAEWSNHLKSRSAELRKQPQPAAAAPKPAAAVAQPAAKPSQSAAKPATNAMDALKARMASSKPKMAPPLPAGTGPVSKMDRPAAGPAISPVQPPAPAAKPKGPTPLPVGSSPVTQANKPAGLPFKGPIPLNKELKQSLERGHLAIPVDPKTGQVNTHLESFYRSLADKNGVQIGKFTVNPRTGNAHATVSRAGGQSKPSTPALEALKGRMKANQTPDAYSPPESFRPLPPGEPPANADAPPENPAPTPAPIAETQPEAAVSQPVAGGQDAQTGGSPTDEEPKPQSHPLAAPHEHPLADYLKAVAPAVQAHEHAVKTAQENGVDVAPKVLADHPHLAEPATPSIPEHDRHILGQSDPSKPSDEQLDAVHGRLGEKSAAGPLKPHEQKYHGDVQAEIQRRTSVPTKASMERELLAHHEATGGKNVLTADDERWLNEVTSGNPWAYGPDSAGEARKVVQDNPALRGKIRAAGPGEKPGFEEAYNSDPRRYEAVANAFHGSVGRAAVDAARNSNDPAIALKGAIVQTTPEATDPVSLQAAAKKKANNLRNLESKLKAKARTPEQYASMVKRARENVQAAQDRAQHAKANAVPKEAVRVTPTTFQQGDTLTINGHPMTVSVDEDGEEILKDHGVLPDTPIAALHGTVLPIDKGSLKHEEAGGDVSFNPEEFSDGNSEDGLELSGPEDSAPSGSLENQFDDFLKGGRDQQWLDDGNGATVYVRQGKHMINGEMRQMLDIPNIRIDESRRGHGTFTRFLDQAEQKSPSGGVFIENVENPRLADFLDRRGYQRDYSSGDPELPSFYRIGATPEMHELRTRGPKNRGEFGDIEHVEHGLADPLDIEPRVARGNEDEGEHSQSESVSLAEKKIREKPNQGPSLWDLPAHEPDHVKSAMVAEGISPESADQSIAKLQEQRHAAGEGIKQSSREPQHPGTGASGPSAQAGGSRGEPNGGQDETDNKKSDLTVGQEYSNDLPEIPAAHELDPDAYRHELEQALGRRVAPAEADDAHGRLVDDAIVNGEVVPDHIRAHYGHPRSDDEDFVRPPPMGIPTRVQLDQAWHEESRKPENVKSLKQRIAESVARRNAGKPASTPAMEELRNRGPASRGEIPEPVKEPSEPAAEEMTPRRQRELARSEALRAKLASEPKIEAGDFPSDSGSHPSPMGLDIPDEKGDPIDKSPAIKTAAPPNLKPSMAPLTGRLARIQKLREDGISSEMARKHYEREEQEGRELPPLPHHMTQQQYVDADRFNQGAKQNYQQVRAKTKPNLPPEHPQSVKFKEAAQRWTDADTNARKTHEQAVDEAIRTGQLSSHPSYPSKGVDAAEAIQQKIRDRISKSQEGHLPTADMRIKEKPEEGPSLWHKPETAPRATEPATSLQDVWIKNQKAAGDGNWQTIEAKAKADFAPVDRALESGQFRRTADLVKGSNEHRAHVTRALSKLADDGHVQRAWDQDGNVYYGKNGATIPNNLKKSYEEFSPIAKPSKSEVAGHESLLQHLTDKGSRENETVPAPVDTSRQLGLYAKDAGGNPMEIGERPGQADLFARGKYRTPEPAAEPKRETTGPAAASDPKHTSPLSFGRLQKPEFLSDQISTKGWPVVGRGHKEPGMTMGGNVVRDPSGQHWVMDLEEQNQYRHRKANNFKPQGDPSGQSKHDLPTFAGQVKQIASNMVGKHAPGTNGVNNLGDKVWISALHREYQKQHGAIPLEKFKQMMWDSNMKHLQLAGEDLRPSDPEELRHYKESETKGKNGPTAYHYLQSRGGRGQFSTQNFDAMSNLKSRMKSHRREMVYA